MRKSKINKQEMEQMFAQLEAAVRCDPQWDGGTIYAAGPGGNRNFPMRRMEITVMYSDRDVQFTAELVRGLPYGHIPAPIAYRIVGRIDTFPRTRLRW